MSLVDAPDLPFEIEVAAQTLEQSHPEHTLAEELAAVHSQ
jgi:hypothetical protein